MAVAFRIVVYCLALYINLFAYNSIEVLSDDVKLTNSGYFVTDKNISQDDAYKLYQNGQFKSLPKEAKSLGFDPARDYWCAFSVSAEKTDEYPLFLDVRSKTLNVCNLYVYKDDKQVFKRQNEDFIKTDKVDFTRFELLDSQAVYLLKIRVEGPVFLAFAFGDKSTVDKIWNYQFFLFAFTGGVLFFVAFFGLFLYFKFKDAVYLFYATYILGLYASIAITQGRVYEITSLVGRIDILVSTALWLQFIGLVLFSEKFLNLGLATPKLKQVIYYVLYAYLSIVAMSLFYGFAMPISFLLALFLFCLLIYAGFVSIYRGFAPAKYYLAATGASLCLQIAFTFTHQGFINYSFWSFNSLSFALIIDALLLTLAIASKIEVLQKENATTERILTLRSRQDSIGEIMGNIAHQWKSPLAELGAMVFSLRTSLMYGAISKEENLDYLTRFSKILQRLSGAVDTFQNLFTSGAKAVSFNLSHRLDKIVKLIEPPLREANIELFLDIKSDVFIYGDSGELTQAILSVIQNAKEAIIERGVKNAKIEISLRQEEGDALITIKDNGGGVKDIDKDKIFEPFVTNKEGGTGIGLFITKTIVENKYAGKLSFKTFKNETEFLIRIPTQTKQSSL
ncbi:MAG TPA: sensor histidine kinase [Campylobacterales bacterium]|nr:sensor histidine kinase [Campylobacterales bacterium]